GPRAPLGQHGVRGHGRPVDDEPNLAQELPAAEPELLGELRQSGQDRLGGIGGGARRLVREERAALLVPPDEVGERAADVDSDREAHRRYSSWGRLDSRSAGPRRTTYVSATLAPKPSAAPEKLGWIEITIASRSGVVSRAVSTGRSWSTPTPWPCQ